MASRLECHEEMLLLQRRCISHGCRYVYKEMHFTHCKASDEEKKDAATALAKYETLVQDDDRKMF